MDSSLARQEEKIKASGKKVFIVGIIVLVLVVVGVLTAKVFLSPNRSAKAAGSAAFEGIYNCDFNQFLKATIYNEKCQKALNMEISADVAELEPLFEEMKEWMKQTGESYKITSASSEEYDAFSDVYAEGIRLFKEAYEGVPDNLIEEVAQTTIEYTVQYKDENDAWQTEDGTDMYWCFYVDGAWYAFPMLGDYDE